MFRYILTLCKNIFMPINNPTISDTELLDNLTKALAYVNQALILGSSNCIKSFVATGGYNAFIMRRMYKGVYKKEQNHWDYYIDEPPAYHLLYSKYPNLNPLEDSDFNLDQHHIRLLTYALIALELRAGNCGDKTILLAKRLWEHCEGINKIQIVETEDFDHQFLVVNCEGDLSLAYTWGNCWVVDPWYKGKGIIYPAYEFNEKIIAIKQYAKKQFQQLENFGYELDADSYHENKKTTLKLKCEIKPQIHYYPTYSTQPFLPIEHYYGVNFYQYNVDKIITNPLNASFEIHQNNFKNSVAKIKMKDFSLRNITCSFFNNTMKNSKNENLRITSPKI